eukprot:m.431037 g.431037  ORF g.431037 m.431037 type:complete len:252 (+) comp17245_c0_seq1:32-787(+)
MASSYDRAITVFSPDGHLFQVEYALEAVNKGTCAVGVRGDDVVVLGVEKRTTAKLQKDRTVKKILKMDDHISVAFAGLTADAKSLIDTTRVECQSYRLSLEDPPSVEHITRFMAQTKQKFTQSNGKRPYGVSCLVIGFDKDVPKLFSTDPSGVYAEWKANAIGRSSKTVREYLEKHYSKEVAQSRRETEKLAVKALLEVVQSGSKSLEVAVMAKGQPLTMMGADELEELMKEIEEDREREAEKKGKKKSSD